MKAKGQKKYVIFMFIGIAMMAVGGWLMKNPSDMVIMEVMPFVLFGIGAGIFGQNIGEIATSRSLRKYPEEAKRLEIEQRDERNVAIANRAKAKAFEMTLYVFGGLLVAFALMGADLLVILTVVVAYLFVTGVMIYFLWKYQKEM